MARNKTALKRYREGNVTSSFGTDLMMQGFTSIPNLLLKQYKTMGISDTEMMLIIQLLRIRSEDKELFPSPERLAKYVQGDVSQIEHDLASLIEKGILDITKYYDENHEMILTGYDFEPLFEAVSEEWACAKVKELEKTQKILEKQEPVYSDKVGPHNQELAQLYRTFENEFARPLSPMEIEQIQRWTRELNNQLIREALRRAVLMGKHNFKYIDSILLEWHKNNLHTIEAINDYDRNFQRRRNTKNYKNSEPSVQSSDSKKKALIKTLYMS